MGFGLGLGMGLGLGSSSAAIRRRRPPAITPEVEQKHAEAHEQFRREAELIDLGQLIVPVSDLLSPEALEQLFPRGPDAERYIQAGSVSLKLIDLLRKEPKNFYRLHPRKFEEVVAEMLTRLGWNKVLLTAARGDGGKDIIASTSIGGVQITTYFECKRHGEDQTVTLEEVRALVGVVASSREAQKGVLVSTGRFSSGAERIFTQEHRIIEGRRYPHLLEWMNEICWT